MRHREPVLHVALLLVALLACAETRRSPGKPDVPVTAADLTRDYAKLGREKADAKWAGKNVRVTGIGHYHSTCPGASLGGSCVMLEGADLGSYIAWVYGWISDSDTKASGIEPMSSITMQCRVPDEFASYGEMVSVSLQDCTVATWSPSDVPSSAPRRPLPAKAPARPTPRKR